MAFIDRTILREALPKILLFTGSAILGVSSLGYFCDYLCGDQELKHPLNASQNIPEAKLETIRAIHNLTMDQLDGIAQQASNFSDQQKISEFTPSEAKRIWEQMKDTLEVPELSACHVKCLRVSVGSLIYLGAMAWVFGRVVNWPRMRGFLVEWWVTRGMFY